jgi:di/tricarboxylate transporter
MYSKFLNIYELWNPSPGLWLAILSSLSASLTHYGINSTSIYFSSGYFTTWEWFKTGFVVATFNLI